MSGLSVCLEHTCKYECACTCVYAYIYMHTGALYLMAYKTRVFPPKNWGVCFKQGSCFLPKNGCRELCSLPRHLKEGQSPVLSITHPLLAAKKLKL